MSEEIPDLMELIDINGISYTIDPKTNTLHHSLDTDIKYDLNKTPVCMACKKIMNFYHAVDTIYDRYDCPCGEDRWSILREFTPRGEKVEEDIKEDLDCNHRRFTPEEMFLKLEEMAVCVSRGLWDSRDLKIYLEFITYSDQHFYYYIECLNLFLRNSDVFVASTAIHILAAARYPPYGSRLKFQEDYKTAIASVYTFDPQNYDTHNRPELATGQVNTYVRDLFDLMV